MRRRVFVAINLPEKIKEKLETFQNRFSELPARWVKKENLHITLTFLGYVKDEDLPKIIEITKEVAKRYKPFQIKLTKVCYGPPKISPPRMVWVIGERSNELRNLQNDLKNSLMNLSIPQLEGEEKGFIPHITLARIRKWEFKRLDPEEKPEIDEDLNFEFKVNSIEVMESHLKRGGSEYDILESIPLKD